MKPFLSWMFIVLAWTAAASSLSRDEQERIVLTVPEAGPTNSAWQLERFDATFDAVGTPQDEGELRIVLRGQNGEALGCNYNAATTPRATTLLDGLNVANMSLAYAGNATTGTLRKRIYHRLAVMGEGATVCGKAIGGTVTGL